MYEVVEIPKPDNLPARRAGQSKYPFAGMKPGQSFVVPYDDMMPEEKPAKFRERVYKSAREYARRNVNGGDQMQFTAALMTEDDKSPAKAYVAGDVVVWRDK